jgi:hypothetical protein
VDGHAGLVPEALVEATEQRAAAGEHDPAVHDVAGELGRGLVERRAHGIDDVVQRLLERLPELGTGHDDGARQAGDHVAAADLRLRLGGQREGRTESHLHLLGGALPQHQGVLLLHPRDDRLVEVVAGRADAHAGDDAAEADHRDLGRAAADVDDHVAGGLVDRQTRADRGRHRLLDDVDPARSGLVAGLLHRALLHGSDAAGHADDHARLGEVATPVHLLDEVAQHLLGRLEVGDHAVLERPDGGDVVGGAADHALGLVADREHLAGGGVHRHHGRFVEHDALAPDIDQRVGGAEVNGHVSADEARSHRDASLEMRCVWGSGPALVRPKAQGR